jgi:primosomal protein N' (replication factor Y)
VIQAYDLDHPCLVAVQRQDFAGFADYELEQRKLAGYPPYCRLVRVIILGPVEAEVESFADQVGERLRRKALALGGLEVVGPAPCPIVRLRSFFRWHCLLKGRRVKDLADIVRTSLEFKKRPEKIRIVYDPDPQSLM